MDNTFLAQFYGKSQNYTDIPNHLYKDYNVKKGLRNEDGTGVLVGLTRVADVVGYTYNEDGTKQVQKKKNIEDSDWFAIEHCDNVYLIFKKINGVVKKVKELMRNDIRYFANDNNGFNF